MDTPAYYFVVIEEEYADFYVFEPSASLTRGLFPCLR
jgi:hypothetical protein